MMPYLRSRTSKTEPYRAAHTYIEFSLGLVGELRVAANHEP